MGKKKEIIEASDFLQENPGAKFQGTKDVGWHSTVGDIQIPEATFIFEGKLVRPFSNSADVSCRCYSLLLQRRITDFGADASFGKVVGKMEEHYGITLPESSIRIITQNHGEKILQKPKPKVTDCNNKGIEQAVIQTDGCMIPKVEFNPEDDQGDLRKTRKLGYKETRLSLGYVLGTIEPYYKATTGEPEQVGEQLMIIARQLGYGQETRIHGVGDGAPWIADQFDQNFEENGSYLIDFFHLCEYLSAASKGCSDQSEDWYKEKKKLMKEGKRNEVLQALLPHLEPPEVVDDNAPVRRCFRYVRNRPEQFNYPDAIEKGLPIGSGKIEGAHRSVVQFRMKISGAWWKVENMDKMLALLTCRENGEWEEYWGNISEAA